MAQTKTIANGAKNTTTTSADSPPSSPAPSDTPESTSEFRKAGTDTTTKRFANKGGKSSKKQKVKKTRAAVGTDASKAVKQKKRSAKSANVVDCEDEDDLAKENPGQVEKSSSTSTSRKRRRGSVTGTTKAGQPRKRNPPPGPTLSRTAIPKSYAECTPADKMLIDWRDAGEDWPKIAEQYERLCGAKTDCKSTLPNRYQRMKSYFAVMHEEDRYFLLEAKLRLDKWWEDEIWVKVADELKKKTSTKYSPDALRRNYKRLMERGDPAAARAKKAVEDSGNVDGAELGNDSDVDNDVDIDDDIDDDDDGFGVVE